MLALKYTIGVKEEYNPHFDPGMLCLAIIARLLVGYCVSRCSNVVWVGCSIFSNFDSLCRLLLFV